MENKILAFLSELGVTLGLKLLSALLVLVIGLKLTKILVKLVKKSRTFSKLDHSIQSFIDSFLSIGLNVLIFLTVAYVLGIPMTSFITILASAGVAIGLALQGSLSNFAGGLMILFFKPFKIGDFIEIAAINGTVKAITVFYTVLLTADNKQITLPNGNLSNASIVNYSTEPKRRVDLTFSVSSHCDLEQVKQILLQTAAAHPFALNDPAPPFARLNRHSDSTLDFILRVWTHTEHYWDLYFDLNEQVKLALDAR